MISKILGKIFWSSKSKHFQNIDEDSSYIMVNDYLIEKPIELSQIQPPNEQVEEHVIPDDKIFIEKEFRRDQYKLRVKNKRKFKK